MATEYDINYDDERFTQVESDKNVALEDLNDTYDGMINQTDNYYQSQIDASKQWADKQSQLQQERTDFEVQKIEQQKEQERKDYLKEQSGAFVDWKKQSNQYGAEAENMAASGLDKSGFSESSQVSMYNTYQSRVASARESYKLAVMNYDNAMTEARLQNSSILAEIAYNALQQQLELSLQGFQYKNQLLLEKANKKTELENTYYNRYQDVLAQINHENAFAEEIRQFEKNYELQQEQLSLQKKELEENIRQFNQNYDLKVKEYNEGIRQFNEEIARLKAKDAVENKREIERLELQKKQLEEEKRQFEESQKLKREQLAEEKRQFDAQYSAKYSSGSGGSTKSGGSKSSGITKKTFSNGGSKSSVSTSKPSSSVINTKSVIALGKGPYNDKTVAKKVASGELRAVQKGDQIYVSKNPSYGKGKALLDKYTWVK